eukprot:9419581-Karenia_brevis.AAC.1
MYAMRTTRPEYVVNILNEYYHSLQRAFGMSTGIVLDKKQWKQAALSTSRGGLGLRSAQRHAAAAY